jgi:hypothetical protein
MRDAHPQRCDARTRGDTSVLAPLVLVVGLCLALGACGVSTSAQPGAEAASTRTISLTPFPSATAGAAPKVTPVTSLVTISLDKAQYHSGDLAIVVVTNGLAHSISTTDHKSSCSIVELEQQVNSSWQAVEPCRLQTPTLVVELAQGSVTEQKIAIPSTPATYRVTLSYTGGDEGTGGPGGIAHSAEFTIG